MTTKGGCTGATCRKPSAAEPASVAGTEQAQEGIGEFAGQRLGIQAAAGDGGKSLTVDQRLAALEALNADLNEQLSHERGLRLNTERYSKLQSLRTKYVFDLDKSAEKVHYKKMNKQGFDGFVNFIQENCQAIHADTLLPVPADGGKDAPAPGRGDRRERYAKECRTRAFAIAEARALRGQEANYEGILESLLDGTYKEPI